jgi:predicted secreted protein
MSCGLQTVKVSTSCGVFANSLESENEKKKFCSKKFFKGIFFMKFYLKPKTAPS